MKKKAATSYDELIRRYYGGSDAGALNDAARFGQLFANYYGKPVAPKGKASIVLSLRCDDGETIAQEPRPKNGKGSNGRQSNGHAGSNSDEYVVYNRPAVPNVPPAVGPPVAGMSWQSSLTRSPRIDHDRLAYQECQVDVLDPLKEAAVPALPARPAPPSLPNPAGDPGHATNDDFMADMQSILTGQKVFDPATKRTVDKDKLARSESSSTTPYGSPPEAANGQAIFDRIAQSMQYANAYDLGTVELKNRFEDFDRISELQRKAEAEKKAKRQTAGAGASFPGAGIGSEDFLRDLDAIRDQQPVPILSSPQSTGSYSYPLYDTGEHVRTSPDGYGERFRVGNNPGVNFSYGQIIAMADLFETVDLMMNAGVSELNRTKALIERSTQYYEGGKANASLDVTSEEWTNVTNKRYLKLAEDNYEHFSPNVLFKDQAFAKAAQKHGDNKSAWEKHHKRAIQEAQKVFMGPQSSKSSVFPEWPLIINAFGDHYLTDAFASGHVINKETMIAYFKSRFLNGSSLRSDGADFFDKVASQAFRGKVAEKFSSLETADYPVCKGGWCIKWHPNIDSASMLGRVLKGAAEQQPDRVANFAVKALHDRLNAEGVDVFNNAGDKWKIMGDGFMNAKTLQVVHKAVQQSIDNINDPSILASNLNFANYFAKVWNYVPQLAESARRGAETMVTDYINPKSDALVKAAADLIYKEVDSLIDTLLTEGKLKHA